MTEGYAKVLRLQRSATVMELSSPASIMSHLDMGKHISKTPKQIILKCLLPTARKDPRVVNTYQPPTGKTESFQIVSDITGAWRLCQQSIQRLKSVANDNPLTPRPTSPMILADMALPMASIDCRYAKSFYGIRPTLYKSMV